MKPTTDVSAHMSADIPRRQTHAERTRALPGLYKDLDSVSEVDQEMLVGERRESDWRDAREEIPDNTDREADESISRIGSVPKNQAVLEDGAD